MKKHKSRPAPLKGREEASKKMEKQKEKKNTKRGLKKWLFLEP